MEYIDTWLPGIKFLLAVMGCTAAVTYSVVLVCKLMKWAPINLTVNVIGTRYDVDDE